MKNLLPKVPSNFLPWKILEAVRRRCSSTMTSTILVQKEAGSWYLRGEAGGEAEA